MRHYKIRVTGKVQGVYFRDTARQVAAQLGVAGFARNDPDGSVYIEVEGNEAALKKFVAWCHEGPQNAVVTDVTHTAHDELAGHAGFEVR